MNQQKAFNIQEYVAICKNKKKLLAGIVAGFAVVSLAAGLVWPKTYESTTTVRTRMTPGSVTSGSALATLAGLSGAGTPTMTYVELMKSGVVLQPIIDKLDWDEDEKKFLTPDKFAKKNLTIESIKQTNIITVSAKGNTPEEAQMIADDVVNNFMHLMTDMNKDTQNTMLKFLNERVSTAKKEAEDAGKKFADYQKEHKMYEPKLQAEAQLDNLAKYDSAISQSIVDASANDAKLQSVSGQLDAMKADSEQFKINDNAVVQDIRNNIVKKEVELVGLEYKYTDEHPSVIQAKAQLKQLEDSLRNEVNAIVQSNAATMNPAQESLVKEQALAEASRAVAQAKKAALEEQRTEKEEEISKLPSEALDYINLEREARIKNEVYTNLVKQYEQSRIEQAMESMDIQVVDKANLPFEEKPIWPRPKLMTAVGGLIGVLVAMLYAFVEYIKRNKRLQD